MNLNKPEKAGLENISRNPAKDSAWRVDSGILSDMPATARWLVLLLAVLMLILGIFRGEVAAVFRKAATICLECIGIG